MTNARLLSFLPEGVRPAGRDELRRAQLTIAACWLSVVIAGFSALMQGIAGVRVSALACLVSGAVSAVLPFYVRRTGRWRRAAAALAAQIWIGTVAVAALTAGTLIPALYYLVFAAAVATITLGLRAGLAVGFANLLVTSAFYALHAAGASVPVAVPPEAALRAAIRGGLLFNLTVTALLAAYEWLRRASARDNEETERRFRALADYGPDLIVEMDATGRILDSNAAFGARRGQMAGRLATEGIHPDDHSALRDAARSLQTQASVRVGPMRWIERTGETRWFESSLTRFKAGSEWRLLAVSRDVTPRVTLEAQLRQSQKMQAV
ncbi:MAG TPA: PAS domain S-box protein, partial [Myxococcota bacterium]|nr:PAS domain S-box protein [Myxococcota bacterium]